MTEVMLSHKRHRADTWVDHIEITTEPRWKASDLSGDEWRFSYTVTLCRKGWKVAEKSFGTLTYAIAWANLQAGGFCPASQPWPANAPGQPYGDGYLCDNPGCPDVAAWRGVLKNIYGRNGEGPLEQPGTPYFRVFCDEHKDRGDCAMEDCTTNYTWTPIEATS